MEQKNFSRTCKSSGIFLIYMVKTIRFNPMRFEEARIKAHKVIQSFPKAKNGKYFLTMKNGRKLFLDRFIKKYGIDGSETKYSKADLLRRLRLVEFFQYFMECNLNPARRTNRFLLDSHFHRMVILQVQKPRGNRYELLSFHPL
jgi:hypothetical protein